MAITNKTKTKNPVLDEIENDETPLDSKGKPIVEQKTAEPSVEDLLKKDPNSLTAADMDVLSKNKEDLTDEQKVQVGLMDGEDLEKTEAEEKKLEADDSKKPEEKKPIPEQKDDKEVLDDQVDQKEQRYKAQQTEAQIQAERNRALTDKVTEAAKIGDPTVDELKAFVKEDGVEWDELTTFEQATAKRTYLAEKRFALVNDAVATQQKSDQWAKVVDDFIDTTDGKPEFLSLSSHESDFRKFAMKEAHRGTPIDILLGAFLHNLPATKPVRGSMFEQGGGGDKAPKPSDSITDADKVAQLRESNPKEFARQLRAGKIKIEV